MRMRRLFTALRVAIGIDEGVFILGLALITSGLWPALHVGALAVPGIILVWLALPSRRSFIERSQPPDSRRMR